MLRTKEQQGRIWISGCGGTMPALEREITCDFVGTIANLGLCHISQAFNLSSAVIKQVIALSSWDNKDCF